MSMDQNAKRNTDIFGRVAVLYGGTSSERTVSLKSGAAIIRALSEENVDVVPVDILENPLQQILAAKADRIFIALHGPGGEDGKIQALLEFLDLPYTGSGVSASSLCMDKLRTKQLWAGVGLPSPKFYKLRPDADFKQVLESLGGCAVVKPSHEGSSIGISVVRTEQELRSAFEDAYRLDQDVLVERYVDGEEYTVAILNGQALPPIRLEPQNKFYDFDAKYESNETKYHCPCGLNEEQEAKLKALALEAFASLGATGWGRVDVMADKENNFYLLEVNTVPGMTDHSLVPMAANAAGLSFNDLVISILKQTLANNG